MTNKWIEDLRKLVLTYEILKKIPNTLPTIDKAPIGSNRGVGLADDTVFNPCQLLYGSQDGAYTFASIVDGTSGQRVQDVSQNPSTGATSYNNCSTLNTISQMRETGTSSPDLTMILKPDGVFLVNAYENWWTNLGIFRPENTAAGFTNPVSGGQGWANQAAVFYPDEPSCATASNNIFALDTIANFGGTFVSSSPETSIPLTITQTIINGTIAAQNGIIGIETTYPAFFTNHDVTTTIGHYNEWVITIGYQKNYSFNIGAPYNSPPDLFIEFLEPNLNDPPQVSVGSNAATQIAVAPSANSFQLAIDANTKLWTPNPLEGTAPAKYKLGVSVIQMDFGDGFTRTGVVRPATNGGFMLYETSTGTPINNAYVYRNDRTLAAIVPVAQLATYVA